MVSCLPEESCVCVSWGKLLFPYSFKVLQHFKEKKKRRRNLSGSALIAIIFSAGVSRREQKEEQNGKEASVSGTGCT